MTDTRRTPTNDLRKLWASFLSIQFIKQIGISVIDRVAVRQLFRNNAEEKPLSFEFIRIEILFFALMEDFFDG
jgi:hypothetical protein